MFSKLEIEGKCFNLTKSLNLYLMIKHWRLCPCITNETRIFSPNTSIQHCTRSLSHWNKIRKRKKKKHTEWKGKLNFLMISIWQNCVHRKHQEFFFKYTTISEFCKAKGYKVSNQNSILVLYLVNEQWESEILTKLFACQNIKYLGINGVSSLYWKLQNIVERETKDDLNKWRNVPSYGLEDINVYSHQNQW